MKRFLILCGLLLAMTATAWALDAQQPAPHAQAPEQGPSQPPAASAPAPSPAPVESAAAQAQPKVEVVKPEDLAKAEAEKKPEPPKPAEKINTVPGAVVYVRPYPASGTILAEADYGAFTSTKYAWDAQEFAGKGVKLGENPYVLEVQTLLVVKDAGLYQFAVDTNGDLLKNNRIDLNYFCLMNLEGNVLTSERKEVPLILKDNRSVGAAKLSPGIYQLQIACGYNSNPRVTKMTYSLLMKGPNDLSFRAPKAEELVIKK